MVSVEQESNGALVRRTGNGPAGSGGSVEESRSARVDRLGRFFIDALELLLGVRKYTSDQGTYIFVDADAYNIWRLTPEEFKQAIEKVAKEHSNGGNA